MFKIRLAANPKHQWEEEEGKSHCPALVGNEKHSHGGRHVFKIVDLDEQTGYFRLAGQSHDFTRFARVEEDGVVRMSTNRDARTLVRIVDDNGKHFRLQPKFDESLNFSCASTERVQLGKARCDDSLFLVEV